MIALYPACWFAWGCGIPSPSHPPAIFHPWNKEQRVCVRASVGILPSISSHSHNVFVLCAYLFICLSLKSEKQWHEWMKALLFGIALNFSPTTQTAAVNWKELLKDEKCVTGSSEQIFSQQGLVFEPCVIMASTAAPPGRAKMMVCGAKPFQMSVGHRTLWKKGQKWIKEINWNVTHMYKLSHFWV